MYNRLGAIRDAGAAVGAARDPDCHVLRRSARLSRRGAAALAFLSEGAEPSTPKVLFNMAGAPALEAVPSGGGVPASGAAPEKASKSACTVALGLVFCMDASGEVLRRRIGEEQARTVAHAIPGSSIAAAVSGEHTVLLYLAPKKTTEGLVSHAFAALDDRPPVQLSEDGSGATFVAVAPRAQELVAMYVDARVALTPVHARILKIGEGLELGRDAVVLVAGGADRWQTGAIGTSATGATLLVVPTTTEDGGFGTATVRLEGEPKDDMPVVWSRYPNGLHPAPVAVTQGRSPVTIARVRPTGPAPGARHLLELGHLAEGGAIEPLCEVADAPSFSHVAVAAGADGRLWLVYTTADGTFLEQRGS